MPPHKHSKKCLSQPIHATPDPSQLSWVCEVLGQRVILPISEFPAETD